MISQNPVTVSRVLSVAALGLVLAACASLKVGQDFDRTSNFSGYRAFSWMPREHYGTRNPLVAQRAREAIQAELTRKGFSNVEDAAAADFVVDFTIGAHDRTDIQSYPAPYADPWGWGHAGWWGYPYWGNEVNVRNYREGTLSIDVFDAHTHRAVWHGWAKKELSQADIDRSEAPIRAAVAAVLEQFPPK
jgi:hypothetical protein